MTGHAPAAATALLLWWAVAEARRAVRGRPRHLRGDGGPPAPVPAGSAARTVRRPTLDRRPGAGRGLELPEVVAEVASAVGAGRSLTAGLAAGAGAADPVLRRELDAVVGMVGRGVAVGPALDRWASDTAVPGAQLVAGAVGLAADAGGDADVALAGVARTLRDRRAIDREIRALSSQARLSASVIAVAPVGFGLVTAAADRSTAAFLLATPAGWACLLGGALLDGLGWRWMRRITSSAVPGGDPLATLPEVVDLLAVAVEAGLPCAAALVAVGPRAPEPWRGAIDECLAVAGSGERLVDALGRLPAAVGDDALALVAVLRAGLADGDSLPAGLDHLATEVRDRRRRRAEEHARRIPVRLLLPLVACSLPAFAVLTIVPILAGALRGLRLP